MTKYKVDDLEGALLDAAVAKAEGFPSYAIHNEGGANVCYLGPVFMERFSWCPSVAWEQGGPIIERERISTASPDGSFCDQWFAIKMKGRESAAQAFGSTPLIAAMRAYVGSKFGGEVEL